MLEENTCFILLHDMRGDVPTSGFESFVSDFRESQSHTVVRSSLQFQQDNKISCCCDSRSHWVRRTVENYQTALGCKFIRTAGTHNPIQRAEFMNTPKLNPLKRD